MVAGECASEHSRGCTKCGMKVDRESLLVLHGMVGSRVLSLLLFFFFARTYRSAATRVSKRSIRISRSFSLILHSFLQAAEHIPLNTPCAFYSAISSICPRHLYAASRRTIFGVKASDSSSLASFTAAPRVSRNTRHPAA